MARRGSKTGEKIQSFREVYGSFSPLRSFTGISPQRLQAIQQGSAPTRSEAAKISAFGRRQELGIVSYELEAASKRRGVGIGQIGRELQDIAKGEFRPKIRLGLPEIAHAMGVDPQAVYRLSQEPGIKQSRKKGGGTSYKEIRPARGISEGYTTQDGKIVAYGSDGNKYVAYKVTNRQTGKAKFFWGRYESIGYLSSAEFGDMYEDDGYSFEVDVSDSAWG